MTVHRVELAPASTSPALARRFVGQAAVRARLAPPLVEVLELLTSELVTNAVVHGLPPIELSVAVDIGMIRVSVHDCSGAPLRRCRANPTDLGGRGLALVDALAQRWRSEADRTGQGKTVWFELDRAPVSAC